MQFISCLGWGLQSDVNLASTWELSPAENHDIIYACNACHLKWDTGDLQSSKHELLVLALKCQSSLGGHEQTHFLLEVVHGVCPTTGWSVERCTSQVAFTCVRVILCMLTCSPLCRAGSCTKECMQVLARREMCEYKWSLYFQKWSIVLRINGKLDHPVIACNCIPGEYTQYSTFSGMGLWFLRWWLWKGLSFLSVYFSKPIRNFKTRRCFSRSYDTFS